MWHHTSFVVLLACAKDTCTGQQWSGGSHSCWRGLVASPWVLQHIRWANPVNPNLANSWVEEGRTGWRGCNKRGCCMRLCKMVRFCALFCAFWCVFCAFFRAKIPKGPKIEIFQDLEIFKQDWKIQASHPPNPFWRSGLEIFKRD